MKKNPGFRRQAEDHFRRARRKARRDQLAAWLTGRQDKLLPFEEIRQEIREQDATFQGLHTIPLDRVTGSVGRYHEFTRHFLPLRDSMRERWVRVEMRAMERGWPPIEVYAIGDVYFVKDGNHRVAIARQLGNETIEAYVYAFPQEESLDPNESLDSWLTRLGRRNFMEDSRLDELYPGHELALTLPGSYEELRVQIRRMREKLRIIDEQDEISIEAAVVAWYELVYLPAVTLIEESQVLNAFPQRTAADLFVWFSQHRNQLRESYGDGKNVGELMAEFAADRQPKGLSRLTQQLLGLLNVGRPPDLPDT